MLYVGPPTNHLKRKFHHWLTGDPRTIPAVLHYTPHAAASTCSLPIGSKHLISCTTGLVYGKASREPAMWHPLLAFDH